MANDLQSDPSDPQLAIGMRIRALRSEVGSVESKLRLAEAPSVLVAVTKTMPETAIRVALEAGHRVFGENRVQEAAAKWPRLREYYPDIELHLIGPLQTNKVKQAIGLFDAIETLDRPKLASALAAAGADGGPLPRLFVQVNTGEEASKTGVPPAEADSFLAFCRDELGLAIEGLMCVPPVDEEPALHFALLHEIARRNALRGLSMGMSGDYETALTFGASHVRLGTAIFGPRGEA